MMCNNCTHAPVCGKCKATGGAERGTVTKKTALRRMPGAGGAYRGSRPIASAIIRRK